MGDIGTIRLLIDQNKTKINDKVLEDQQLFKNNTNLIESDNIFKHYSKNERILNLDTL